MVLPSPPRAILLDLDGTLVDSLVDLAGACNAARREFGLEPLAVDEIGTMVGDGARHLVARAFDLPLESAEVDERLTSFQRAYGAAPCVATKLLPGAARLVTTAKEQGITLAVVTNKPRAPALAILDRLALTPSLRHVYAGGDGPLKPDPGGILTTLAAVGVARGDAWMVGDGPQDVWAARRAGVASIAVPGIASRASVEAAGPDWMAANLDEVTTRLASTSASGGGARR